MYDLHCHLLPGLDDGPVEFNETIDMIREAAEDGIEYIVCTPHIDSTRAWSSRHRLEKCFAELQGHLQSHGLPVTLGMGGDILYSPFVLSGLQNHLLPTLNSSRYFLLDFARLDWPETIFQDVRGWIKAGYIPIIVHPERAVWIEERWLDLAELASIGAWIQLTADSVTGLFGPRAAYWAEKLLSEGLVHVLASEAHGMDLRPPIMSEAVDKAKSWLGKKAADHLVNERPAIVLADEILQPELAPAALQGTVFKAASSVVSPS